MLSQGKQSHNYGKDGKDPNFWTAANFREYVKESVDNAREVQTPGKCYSTKLLDVVRVVQSRVF